MNEPTQGKLGDFLILTCMLAHKYFGDLASGKICPETNQRHFVVTHGRGTLSYNNLKGVFGCERAGAREIRRFSHFSCELAHKYFGNSAFGKKMSRNQLETLGKYPEEGYVKL